jgi:two-component system CheB/CheR fusion protein
MARLLDDLLDVARYGQSKIEFRKEVVDLSALADDVLEAVNYEIEGKNQILHATIGEGPLCVFADPARIKQAQVNLLNNASKYSPEAEDIWYEVDREGDQAVITVRDQGEGIPQDLLDSIFDLFVQSETSLARSSGGIGVGLSLARTIVEAHEGTIRADSDGPGKGSVFRIRLPLTDPAIRPQPPEPHFSVEGRKLLLVEDNDDARMMLVRTLRLKGFVVKDAADGRAALRLFHSFRPEVAVIDIGLPGMDGYQLARTVRESDEFADTLLIALTGYARQADRHAATNAGFDVHLVKPLNPAELYAQISNATKRSTQDAT